MNIEIHQKKISIGDKYRIYINGQELLKVNAKLIKMMAEFELIENMNQIHRINIKRKMSFFKAKYIITYPDGKSSEFITVNLWKRHYQYNDGFFKYDIYGHKGRKYSIYRNDIQVGWFEKNAVAILGGDVYKMVADDDAYHDLMIAFIIVIDNYAQNNKQGAVNISFGSVGPQVCAFNPEWQPRVLS